MLAALPAFIIPVGVCAQRYENCDRLFPPCVIPFVCDPDPPNAIHIFADQV